MESPMPSPQSKLLIPANAGIALSLFGMAWIARVSPLFGAMYEGLGERLPVFTRWIYHPSLYIGVPTVVCLLLVGFNLALPKEGATRIRALGFLLLISLGYTICAGLGLYLPIIQASRVA